MSRTTKQLQRAILARVEASKPKPRKLPKQAVVNRGCEKTNLMLILEVEHGAPIEELIWQGSIFEVMERLNVSNYTVSAWRRKFPIAYQRGKNNRKLPLAKSSGNNGANAVS